MSDNLKFEFLTECRDHLEGIEADILLIEEGGINADIDLVNKVFRAAHSIKGGAAFLNLGRIKALSHRIETVLDLMRSRKLAPNAEIVNILLNAFDLLRNLVNDPEERIQFDIETTIEALQSIVNSLLAEKERGSLQRNTRITFLEGKKNVAIPEIDLQIARRDNQFIYGIELDLLHDIERKGKTALNLLNELSRMGVVVDSIFDISTMGTLDDEPVRSVIILLLYRTVLELDMVETAVGVSGSKIHILENPNETIGKAENRANEQKKAEPAQMSTNESSEKKVDIKLTEIIKENTDQQSSSDEHSSIALPETIRINIKILDILMSHAGELVLSRNQLMDAIQRTDQKSLQTSAQRLSFVISELQEAVMQTRL